MQGHSGRAGGGVREQEQPGDLPARVEPRQRAHGDGGGDGLCIPARLHRHQDLQCRPLSSRRLALAQQVQLLCMACKAPRMLQIDFNFEVA